MIQLIVFAAVAGSTNDSAAIEIRRSPAVCQFSKERADIIPFGDDTRQALGQAHKLAIAAHNDAISSAHVALGLLSADNAATDALRVAHVDTARLAARVRALLPKTVKPIEGPDLPYDVSGKAVLCLAIRHAEQHSKRVVTTLDLLAALTQGGKSSVAAALQHEAIDSAAVEQLSRSRSDGTHRSPHL